LQELFAKLTNNFVRTSEECVPGYQKVGDWRAEALWDGLFYAVA
jgi:hypothetical protein